MQFNIRVYGLLIHENRILLSDECRKGFEFTKFPGGGLEFGEGLEEALKREFREELGIDIQIKSLFYVNPHLQLSRFDQEQQLLSFYYFVSTKEIDRIHTNSFKPVPIPEGESHRWVSFDELIKEEFTFPIDVLVQQLLMEQFC